MISFNKKPDSHPVTDQTENRFERIRKAAKVRHRKRETDATRPEIERSDPERA
jgi:hypothetical protein